MLALSALGAATPALATACKGRQIAYGTECETEKEYAEFQAFAHCPLGEAPINPG